jgi:dimethylamine---corrinoid protein Co-methyltransferase
MSNKILTRMGGGSRKPMEVAEIREDLAQGSRDAAERGKISALTADEQEQLTEIFLEPGRIVSVAPGNEVITTDDAVSTLFFLDKGNSGQGIPMSRTQSLLAYERACAADTISFGHTDYSYKPVKSIVDFEAQEYYHASQLTTAPFFYGAQPNLGLYFQPDGPFPNPSELLPAGKIEAGMQAQVDAAEHLERDLLFVSRKLYEAGCEGINFDTSGSAGDADLYAALKAIKQIKETMPDMAVELGMASEFVLGMHGEIHFEGERLAGMYPHKQVKVAAAAGADIFGPAINIKASKSIPWNLARAVTFVKATVAVAEIPVHPNVGMGVCGVPMFEVPPIDCVTRAAKALVEIGKADGL